MDVLADLVARGLVQDSTDPDALAARLGKGPTTLYWGCDPSADSLHIGNLIGILVLRRFGEAGHRPIALAGGATGMIGDPSGRSDERNLLDDETLARNLAGIADQLARLGGAPLVDNSEWTADVPLLSFLRDIGKHVTVNQMVAKESVRARMEGTDGISYTEFTYMLLQAHDYLRLHERRDCELQIGGSDQWGNITMGVDLVRKVTGHHVHALTWPLLTRTDGRKFGKTAAGSVWLSAERTSPYQLHQYFLQVPDADVRRMLLWFTLLAVEDCEALAAAHAAEPSARLGQRRLAQEVTALVHGEGAAASAEAAGRVLFGADLDELPPDVLASLEGEVETTVLDHGRIAAGIEPVELFAEAGVASSRSDARRSLDQGALYVNNRRLAPDAGPVGEPDLRAGRYVLLRKGKRTYHLLKVAEL
ncbi:MAG: tyrosine--tRNA ligase [Acidimicrobiales bacterium]